MNTLNTHLNLTTPNHPIASAFGSLIGYWGEFFLSAIPIFYAYKWIAWNFNLPEATYLNCVCLYFLWKAFWHPIRFLSNKD